MKAAPRSATSQTRSFSTQAGICAPLTRRNGAGLDPETSQIAMREPSTAR
jgi:hypothetical protein